MKLIDAFRQRDYPANDDGYAMLEFAREFRAIRDHNRRARFLQGLLWFALMAAGMLAALWPQAKTEAPSPTSNGKESRTMNKETNNTRVGRCSNSALGAGVFVCVQGNKKPGELLARRAISDDLSGQAKPESISNHEITKSVACLQALWSGYNSATLLPMKKFGCRKTLCLKGRTAEVGQHQRSVLASNGLLAGQRSVVDHYNRLRPGPYAMARTRERLSRCVRIRNPRHDWLPARASFA